MQYFVGHSIDFYKFKKQKNFNVVCCFSKKINQNQGRNMVSNKSTTVSYDIQTVCKKTLTEKTDEASVLLIQPFNLKIYFYNFKLK